MSLYFLSITWQIIGTVVLCKYQRPYSRDQILKQLFSYVINLTTQNNHHTTYRNQKLETLVCIFSYCIIRGGLYLVEIVLPTA